MQVRMWSKGNTPPLLIGVQTCTTTLEINLMFSKKIGNSSTSRPSYTTSANIHNSCPTLLQGHLINYIHRSFICNSQKQHSCPATEKWIKNMWYIYTMECYLAIKNKDIMKFEGKWIELETIILSEII